MPERIHTSAAAENVLNRLRNTTRLDYAVLARIALALSVKTRGKTVPESSDITGKEVRYRSLFGEDELTLNAVLSVIYGKRLNFEDEEVSKMLKNHVDHGCELLSAVYDQGGQDWLAFMKRLVSEASLTTSGVLDGEVPALDIELGQHELSGSRVVMELNNTIKHANSHLAIMGSTGVGKTQLLLKILADIRMKSQFRTNFIYFDYKGDVGADQKFLEATRCEVFKLPHDQLPVNPFVLQDYSDSAVMLSTEEKAESFASIDSHIGPVQKGSLSDSIRRAYEARRNHPLRYPDFREVLAILRDRYSSDGKKDDTLTETLRRLTDFRLFWEHDSDQRLVEKLYERTICVDLHHLPVLKELVAYLVIERLYKEMAFLPDSPVSDHRRAIRTVLVIDEAHNYLPQNNPFLQKIVREGRSKGVAVFFASQSPNDYVQKTFDFKELLGFTFIFQCQAISSSAVQELLGCSAKTAKDLQVQIARLAPWQVVAKSLSDRTEVDRFKADAFYKVYD